MRRGAPAVLGFLLVVLGLLGPSVVLAADVNELYKVHCLKCHGTEGKGDGEALKKVKGKSVDWTNKAEMMKLADADIVNIIVQGGGGVGKSKIMPAYKGKLSEQEAKELAAFVRTFAK